MELVTRKPRRYHVSQDAVDEFETAILRDPRVEPARMNGAVASVVDSVTRILMKTGIDVPVRTTHDSVAGRDYIAVMMELDLARVAPWFIRRARKSVYLFDAWPGKHGEIASAMDSWGIRYAFISSSQAAAQLSTMSAKCTFAWIPEGVDVSRYRQVPFGERDIDVLQLGRKYDAHHNLIAPALSRARRTYLFEKEKGRLVFQGRDAFVDGLARSRISICVPSNITHPERAGNIETLTLRYLQSMASKCLILGHAPAEMIELFGYNPVVEIDMSRAAEQIEEILGNHEAHAGLIERNYAAVVAGHTWAHRWESMAALLFAA